MQEMKNSRQYFELHLCYVEGSTNRHRRVIGRPEFQLVTPNRGRILKDDAVHSERSRWVFAISDEFIVLGAVPLRLYTLKGNMKEIWVGNAPLHRLHCS